MKLRSFTNLACLLAVSFGSLSPTLADEKKPVGDKPATKSDDKKAAKPKITVAKDVTYFTEPLDENGYVDFVAALNRIYSKGVTPENNAVVPLYKAFGPAPERSPQPDEFFKLLGMVRPPADGDYFKTMAEVHRRDVGPNLSGELWDQFLNEQSESMQRPWKDGELAMIAKWVQTNEGPMKHVTEAASRPHHFSPLVVFRNGDGESSGLIGVLLPGIQQSRDFARVLIARAMNHLGEGRTKQAWDDLIVIRKLGRLVGQGSTLIEALVGIAIESISNNGLLNLIQHSKPDANQVAKYLDELSQLDKSYPPSSMGDKIAIGERAMFMDSVQMIARGSHTIDQLLLGAEGNGGGEFSAFIQKYAVGLVDWDIVMRNGNVWYDRMAKVMKIEDYAERRKASVQIETDIKEHVKQTRGAANLLLFLDAKNGRKAASEYTGRVLIGLLLPAVTAAKTAEDRAVQNNRLLKLALALSAYRVENEKYPAELSALTKYLDPIPGDAFGNAALTYKPTDDGYQLYSNGANGKDEDGNWRHAELQGDDIGIRVPVPIDK